MTKQTTLHYTMQIDIHISPLSRWFRNRREDPFQTGGVSDRILSRSFQKSTYTQDHWDF